MEPSENPYAALLAIDVPAIKSREYEYLIRLRDSQDWVDETDQLLNLHYSAALAEYLLEIQRKTTHEKSSESLGTAITRFPWVIAPLFYELKLPFPAAFPTTVPPSPLQSVYTDLYLHRSKDIWSTTENASWLVGTATSVASDVPLPSVPPVEAQLPLNVSRHVFVMNVPALMSHIPREYTARTQLASDPLPPGDSISPYDVPMRDMARMARSGDEDAMRERVEGLMRRDDDEEEQGDEEQTDQEGQDWLIAQLTAAYRNAVGWFAWGQEERD
jgi:transcription factor 25